ncbi:hypothetical protein JR316_0008529 [Psilocybe cubensis]|uniref:Uncharacterized protein n=2 Tax=Psilocybe cubensis TaxID=181762 RepID=A0ACB8GWC1_PSICU|nr:hypothetical protein JR316_0008529 [Psilocybe cubensis]KAH9479933.1 hypothetical protein JR316_0008529 [Psilocybe cubensis]
MFHPVYGQTAASKQSKQVPYLAPPNYPKAGGSGGSGYNRSLVSNYFPHPQTSRSVPVPPAMKSTTNSSGPPYAPGPSQLPTQQYRAQYPHSRSQGHGTQTPHPVPYIMMQSTAGQQHHPYPPHPSYPYLQSHAPHASQTHPYRSLHPHGPYPSGSSSGKHTSHASYHPHPSWNNSYQGNFPQPTARASVVDMNTITPDDPRYYVPRPKSRTPSPTPLWSHGQVCEAPSGLPSTSASNGPVFPTNGRPPPSPDGAPPSGKYRTNEELQEARERGPLKSILKTSHAPPSIPTPPRKGTTVSPKTHGHPKVKDPQTDDVLELKAQLSAVIGKHNPPRSGNQDNSLSSLKTKGSDCKSGYGNDDDASSTTQASDWGTISPDMKKVAVIPRNINGVEGISTCYNKGNHYHWVSTPKPSTDRHIRRPPTPYNKERLLTDTPGEYIGDNSTHKKVPSSSSNERKDKLSAYALGLTPR